MECRYEFDNCDTDKIMPKQFLKTIQRKGLGKAIMFEDRYQFKSNGFDIESVAHIEPDGIRVEGAEVDGYVLNTEPYSRFFFVGQIQRSQNRWTITPELETQLVGI